jgi:hypothetical protein
VLVIAAAIGLTALVTLNLRPARAEPPCPRRLVAPLRSLESFGVRSAVGRLMRSH